MISKSNNSTHDATVVAAEGVRQQAAATATTQAQQNTATIAFYRSVLASAISNNLDQGPFLFALKTLGTGP